MILVDTSIWIDHFRVTDTGLVLLLGSGQVIQHPFVTAEIALGIVAGRAAVIALLAALPQAEQVSDQAMLNFIGQSEIHGTGLGLVDAHLLGAVAACTTTRLWTRNKRLAAKADEMGRLYRP